MKQKFYSLLLLLALAVTAHAADKQWCLVVESAGGETIAIGADLKPVIKTVADGYELCYGETVTAFHQMGSRVYVCLNIFLIL